MDEGSKVLADGKGYAVVELLRNPSNHEVAVVFERDLNNELLDEVFSSVFMARNVLNVRVWDRDETEATFDAANVIALTITYMPVVLDDV